MIRAALVLAALCVMLSPSVAQTYRKESLRIPFAAAGPRGLEAMLVRPDDGRRYPLALLSHGTVRPPEDRRSFSAGRMYGQAIEFARRGFAVLIVVRRGYGNSDGEYVESSAPCASPDYIRSARTSAEDIRAAVAAIRTRADVSTDGMIAIGQSAGGLASVAYAAEQPRGLAAVFSFAGGRGSVGDRTVCEPDRLVAAFGLFGQTARVPMLWVYTQNDLVFWPELARRFHAAFQASGGRATFIAAPSFGDNGHFLFSSRGASTWLPMVDTFLTEHKLGLRTPLPPPAADVMAPPAQASETVRTAFKQFLLAGEHRAFAISTKGNRYGWRSGLRSEREARVAALEGCEKTGESCGIYAVDDELESERLRRNAEIKPGARGPSR